MPYVIWNECLHIKNYAVCGYNGLYASTAKSFGAAGKWISFKFKYWEYFFINPYRGMANKKRVHVDKYQHIFLSYPQDALAFGEGGEVSLGWDWGSSHVQICPNLQWPSTPHATLTSPGIGKRIPVGPIPILEEEVGLRSMVGWLVDILSTFLPPFQPYQLVVCKCVVNRINSYITWKP